VSGYTAKFGGLILGADRSLGDDWRLGAALNYSNTSVRGKDNLSGNTSTADNCGIIGYAGYTGQPWYLNLSAGLNRQNYSSVRRAEFTGFSALPTVNLTVSPSCCRPSSAIRSRCQRM
jgi:outer membrane autotransporter protein